MKTFLKCELVLRFGRRILFVPESVKMSLISTTARAKLVQITKIVDVMPEKAKRERDNNGHWEVIIIIQKTIAARVVAEVTQMFCRQKERSSGFLIRFF